MHVVRQRHIQVVRRLNGRIADAKPYQRLLNVFVMEKVYLRDKLVFSILSVFMKKT
ncbi:MAG TPA: hypothetical protein PKW28_16570 [Turneriella sp.]|nr:hypothetical protein [Turneriella sp.]